MLIHESQSSIWIRDRPSHGIGKIYMTLKVIAWDNIITPQSERAEVSLGTAGLGWAGSGWLWSEFRSGESSKRMMALHLVCMAARHAAIGVRPRGSLLCSPCMYHTLPSPLVCCRLLLWMPAAFRFFLNDQHTCITTDNPIRNGIMGVMYYMYMYDRNQYIQCNINVHVVVCNLELELYVYKM